MTILVTGGAGFIGSYFVLDWFAQTAEPVINLDKLACAGILENLASLRRGMNRRSTSDKGRSGGAACGVFHRGWRQSP